MMKWSHIEEESEAWPRGLWKKDLVDDLVDMIIANDNNKERRNKFADVETKLK